MESLTEFPLLSQSAVIVVMGVTGSGKSSFVSLLADESVEVSHGLRSHTIRGRPYSFRDPASGEPVILIDMPGFDDTSRSDAEILKELSYSLAVLHLRNVRLAGLIYLHRISDPRMHGSAIKNLRLFKGLCGERNYRHVVLVTNMWPEAEEEWVVGQQRQQELIDTYWADMIRRGSRVMKHRNSRDSALDIVRILTGTRQSVMLAIQQELVVEGRTLGDTAVGKALSEEIDTDRNRLARNIEDLDSGLGEAERDGDRGAAASIRAEREAAEAQAAWRARDGEGLGVSLGQLAEEHRPLYAAFLREEEQRSDERRDQFSTRNRPTSPHNSVDATSLSSNPDRLGIVGTRSKSKETKKSGLVRKKGGKPYGITIPGRTSSVGKTICRPELEFFLACAT